MYNVNNEKRCISLRQPIIDSNSCNINLDDKYEPEPYNHDTETIFTIDNITYSVKDLKEMSDSDFEIVKKKIKKY